MNLGLIQLFSFLLLAPQIDSPSDTGDRNAVIKVLENGKVLCQETTRIKKDNGLTTIKTDYTFNQDVFASKVYSYQNNLEKADYQLYNKATGHKESVSFKDGIYVLNYQESSNDKEKTAELKVKAPAVYDEGLVLFVQNNLSKLKAGEKLEMSIIVPERLDYFRFVASLVDQDDEQLYLEVVPDNFILRQVVKPVKLSFDKKSGRLVELTGLSKMSHKKIALTEVLISYKSKD